MWTSWLETCRYANFCFIWRAEKFLAAESVCNEARRHDKSKTICLRTSALWVLKLILDLGIRLLTKHGPFVSCSGAFDHITWSSLPGLGSWDAGGDRYISVTLRWIAKEINTKNCFSSATIQEYFNVLNFALYASTCKTQKFPSSSTILCVQCRLANVSLLTR